MCQVVKKRLESSDAVFCLSGCRSGIGSYLLFHFSSEMTYFFFILAFAVRYFFTVGGVSESRLCSCEKHAELNMFSCGLSPDSSTRFSPTPCEVSCGSMSFRCLSINVMTV